VRIYLQHRDYAQEVESAEFARLRQRHSDHIVALTRVGIAMRLVRRHRLDDPRITDEARAILVQNAMARRKAAWLRVSRKRTGHGF
jgi:DNA transposition AAA+ family ATPase